MARIQTSKFAGRKGATLKCGKCGRDIPKGETYRWFSRGFRSRAKAIRCFRNECTPRQSEMTTSKMAGVWAATETATDDLNGLLGVPGEVSDIESILATAAEEIEGVAQEYRDAAEASPTGLVFGEDLNERADVIEEGANELSNWSPDGDLEDAEPCELHTDEETAKESDESSTEGDDLEQVREACPDCQSNRAEKWDEIVQEAIDAIDNASFE